MGITARREYITSNTSPVIAYHLGCDVWAVSDIPHTTLDGISALRYMLLYESQKSLYREDRLLADAHKNMFELRATLMQAAQKTSNRELATHVKQVEFLLAMAHLILNDAPHKDLPSSHTCAQQEGSNSVFTCAKCLRYLLQGLGAAAFKQQDAHQQFEGRPHGQHSADIILPWALDCPIFGAESTLRPIQRLPAGPTSDLRTSPVCRQAFPPAETQMSATREM